MPVRATSCPSWPRSHASTLVLGSDKSLMYVARGHEAIFDNSHFAYLDSCPLILSVSGVLVSAVTSCCKMRLVASFWQLTEL